MPGYPQPKDQLKGNHPVSTPDIQETVNEGKFYQGLQESWRVLIVIQNVMKTILNKEFLQFFVRFLATVFKVTRRILYRVFQIGIYSFGEIIGYQIHA